MSESVAWAVITPLLMFCLLGMLQVGVWLHGQNTARSAAATGAELAAVGSGAQSGAVSVAAAGGLRNVVVRVDQTPGSVSVTVVATVPIFFDLGQGAVQATSRAPLEQVTRP